MLCLVRHLTYCAEKQRKKAQQEVEEEQESDGKGTMKKSQSDVHPIPDCLLILIVPQASAPTLIVPSVRPLSFLLILSLIPSLFPHLILGTKKSVKSNTKNKVGKKQPPKPKPSESDSSSLSDPDDEFNKAAKQSSDEDDPDGEEDLDVAGMTEQDALKLLDDEVRSFFLSHYLIEFY